MARVSRKAQKSDGKTVCPKSEKPCKAALYVRLSAEDERKKASGSAAAQRALLEDFAKKLPDTDVVAVYEDINRTGTNYNRPAFRRMLEDIYAGRVNCVIVKDLSRLGRSFEETGHFLERLFPALRVRFISICDNYDSETVAPDSSGLVVPLKNLCNELYARDISKKTQSAKRAKQLRGEYCGSFAPYGYIKDGQRLAVDSETAPVVCQIFKWVLEGESDTAIARKLNAMNILPPGRYRFEKGIVKNGGDAVLWHKSAVGRICENPVYTGVMASGKYQSAFLRRRGTVAVPSGEWLITQNAHPAIIEKEVFDKAGALRGARKAKRRWKGGAAGG